MKNMATNSDDDLIDLRPDQICQENLLEEFRNLKVKFLYLYFLNELINYFLVWFSYFGQGNGKYENGQQDGFKWNWPKI